MGLHLSKSSMEDAVDRSHKHKKFVEASQPCVDCKPPEHAMHYAKRMRSRKESMPEIDLPLAFKNGHDNLSLWTMQKQVQADTEMVKRALHRVDCTAPVHAMRFAKWKRKQRRVAEGHGNDKAQGGNESITSGCLSRDDEVDTFTAGGKAGGSCWVRYKCGRRWSSWQLGYGCGAAKETSAFFKREPVSFLLCLWHAKR